MPSHATNREIARAIKNHGVATKDTLRLSQRQIDDCCRAGVLIRRSPGVYTVAGTATTPQQDLAAAVASAGWMAAGWGRSAAALWTMLDEYPAVPEVVVPRRRVVRLRGMAVHRSTDLCPEHITRCQGIAVTNPFVTILDLGAVVNSETIAEAIVRATNLRLVTMDGVVATLLRLARPGRTGIRNVRAAVDLLESLERPLESVLELRFVELARRFELPDFEPQHEVRIGRRRLRIDFALPDIRLAIEVDGYAKRETPSSVADGLARQNALVLAGWTVLRFDWDRIVRRPHEVAAEIRAALGSLGYETRR